MYKEYGSGVLEIPNFSVLVKQITYISPMPTHLDHLSSL